MILPISAQNKKVFCYKCGILCKITPYVQRYNEDTGDMIWHYTVKCPKRRWWNVHHYENRNENFDVLIDYYY